jgi:hypothetical protein
VEVGLIPQLCAVISKCFIEYQAQTEDLLSQVVAGKLVHSDEQLLDLLNYTIGTIKCFTQSSREVQQEVLRHKMVPLLALVI